MPIERNVRPGRARQRGYTLIELLVVLAVMGVLTGMMLPLAELTLQRDREHELRRALWEIRDAIDAYKRASDAGGLGTMSGRSGYPPTLLALTQGTPDARAGGRVVYFLRRVPRDPFADPAIAAEATWGLRSHDSPPEAPQPGNDVFDVFSQSTRTGLNGVPLKAW